MKFSMPVAVRIEATGTLRPPVSDSLVLTPNAKYTILREGKSE
jgi:hypothetical protein